MNPKTCGAKGIVTSALLHGYGFPGMHTTHNCVRTDLTADGEHLGEHHCACGQEFTVLPMPAEESQPANRWTQVVDRLLAKLSMRVVETAHTLDAVERRQQADQRRTEEALHQARITTGVARAALDRVAGLAARVDSLSGSLAALERQVDDLAGQQPQSGRDAFWQAVEERRVSTSGKAAATRIAAVAVTEIRAGAPMVLVVKALLAEANHVMLGHTTRHGRMCAPCLTAADQILALYPAPPPPTDTVKAVDFSGITTPPGDTRGVDKSAHERLAGLADISGTFQFDPAKAGALYFVGRDDDGNISAEYSFVVENVGIGDATHQPGGASFERTDGPEELTGARPGWPAGPEIDPNPATNPGFAEAMRNAQPADYWPYSGETVPVLDDDGTPSVVRLPSEGACRRTHDDISDTNGARLCGTCGWPVKAHPNWVNQPTDDPAGVARLADDPENAYEISRLNEEDDLDAKASQARGEALDEEG